MICQGHSGWGTEFRPIEHFVPYKNHQHIFPDLRFTIIDLTTMADDKIRGTSYLRILFLTLKYIHNPVLPEKIRDIIVIFKELNDDPEAPEYFKALMKYLEGAAKESLFLKLQDKIKRTLNEGRDQMSRLLEGVLEDFIKKKLEETAKKSRIEGRLEGIEKERIEIAHKMITIGLSDDLISKITGFTIEQVQELRKSPQ